MRSFTPDPQLRNAKVFTALLIAFVILVTPVLPVMAAAARHAKSNSSGTNPAASEALKPHAPAPTTIEASKTDSFPDPNNDGKAEPGDTITYDVNVKNSGAVDATGVNFTDTIDPNTTLVPGSLRVSPLAFAESYNATINTPLNIPAPGVLANDTGTPAPTAVPIVAGPTTGGGTVTLNADGSFLYTPATGFTGADTFTYTATNGLSPDDTATVTINVDEGPAVTTTTPANGANNVPTNTNITVNFSEPVNATTSSFVIECPTGSPQAYTLSASPAAAFTLDPVADLPAGTTCTVTVVANQISDADTFDPPDQMAANYVFSFSLKPVAVDDMETATGNVRIDSANSGYSVLANDQGAGLIITAYDATSAQGGSVNMNTATGTFTYNPPRGFEGADSFNYTITTAGGSDVGTVVITVTDMVWFINNTPGACASNCDGRLTNPYTNLAAFEADNGSAGVGDPEAGDHIFIYSGTGNYTAPLTLENNQRVIGQGATSSIETLAGITFAPDSDPTPSTGGTNPTITSAGNGINLAQNNSLHGFTISNTAGTGVSGNNFGTLTVSEHVIVNNTTGVPVNLSNGDLAATFQSISSNGAANGIVLNTTTGNFSVSGNGGSCTSAASCTGGAILNSTSGVSLTNASGVSLDRVFIQNSTDSGVKGTRVTNFTFTNGVIDNSGTGLGVNTSNIAFNNQVAGTENNLNGTLTVTNSTLTNAFYHGIDVSNFDGTLTSANISNNIITSTNSTATSKGSGIRLIAFGSATTVASVTAATISGNTISNFPSGAGILALGGNSNAAGAAGTYGIAGSATDIVSITGNTIKGNSPAIRMGTNAIQASVNGKGQGNFDISNNGTLANPITNIAGIVISHSSLGVATVTSTISNNVIVANHQVAFGGPAGISIGTDQTALVGTTASLTIGVANNSVSQVDGNGIVATARQNTTLNITVKNNTVAAPLSGNRQGILVQSNAVAAGNTTLCLDILGNTSAGSGVATGIGLRKQGTNPAVNVFGIEGMAATASPGVEAFVNGQNPAGGGTTLTMGTSGFANCSSAPVAMNMPLANSQDELAQANKPSQNNNAASTFVASSNNDAAANNRTSSSTEMLLAHARSTQKGRKSTTASATMKPSALTPAAPSGETVNATIGTLPAGKTVHIQFQVTVDNPLPSSVTQVSNQGTVSGDNFTTVQTDDPADGGSADPTVTLILTPPDIAIHDASASEPSSGSAPAAFAVVLSHAYSQTVTVNFSTANDTGGANPATAGSDYTTTSGSVTFNPGETVQTISVPVLADADNAETDETFLVNLTGTNVGTITDSQAVGTITTANTPGTVVISELRTSGPAVSDDDFVELLNNTDADITVQASDASAGWALAKVGASCSDTPIIVAVIPNGTVIPARGNYLLVGSAYSLGLYATGDQTLTSNIEDDRNVALFNTANLSNFQTGTRLDAVGFGTNTGNNCDLVREGATLQPAGGSLSEYSFVREVDKGETLDTNDNAADFIVVSTTPGTPVGSNNAPTLGAPGPENKTGARGPVPCNAPGTAKFDRARLDASQAVGAAPNLVHDATSDPLNNSTYGTMDFRRTFTNNTGGSVTRLRFRIVDMTTSPAAASSADLRARSSSLIVVGPSTVQGTTLETPPVQALGGGVNSTLAASTVTLGTPLANGASINLRFLFGIEQHGDYHIGIVIETVTSGNLGQDVWELRGHTQNGGDSDGGCNTPPVANAGADQTIECAGATTSVTLDGSASTDPDGDTPLTYEWREGATVLGTGVTLNTSLPFGPHTITLKVTDPSGAFSEDTVSVNIVDTTNPMITAPPNVSVSTGPGATTCGAFVSDATLGNATASDGCSATVTITRTGVPAGNNFPVGTTIVTYTADDGHGHTASAMQSVTVTDNTPPTLSVPPNQTVNAPPNSCSANVNPGTATASDNCPGVTVTGTRSDSQPLNAPYPVGVTTITWKATDAANNTTTGNQTITVKDATPPVITLTTGTITLSPPNHSYQTFTISSLVASVSDQCDASVDINDVVISQVTSDEVENGAGDGNTLNDIVITPDCKSVQLRRERDGGGDGRVYKITLKVKDSSGNVTTAVRQVIVPRTGSTATDSGVHYTVNGCTP
jgi:hypothetical protein